MLKDALSRRSLLLWLPVALMGPISVFRGKGAFKLAVPLIDPTREDVSPALMQAICAHCAVYSDVGRLRRKTDAAASKSAASPEDTGALDLALDFERQLLMSVCAYPARNDAERHDKSTYLLGIFDGSEHVTALLISMKMRELNPSPCDLPPTRMA